MLIMSLFGWGEGGLITGFMETIVQKILSICIFIMLSYLMLNLVYIITCRFVALKNWFALAEKDRLCAHPLH